MVVILATNNSDTIKSLGRGVKNYVDAVWSERRQEIVYQRLLVKFEQNPELREKLLEAVDDILEEYAVRDKIWGISFLMTDERC